MSKLPISVIVPHKKSRKEFFEGYSLPSIQANNPLEIIIINEDGLASVKRNKGASQAKGEYLFFCDDDVILDQNCLKENYKILKENPKASFSYSNFLNVIVLNLESNIKRVFPSNARDWDPELLFTGNYIDTGSLVKKESFMGFDETLPKYEDWELWIRMMKSGKVGVYTKKLLYISFKIDASVSLSVPNAPALDLLRKKHPELKI